MDNLPELSSVSSLGMDWLKAIHKGDCLEIEDLLNKDQCLINIYPRSLSCKDSKVFAAHFGGWRGCSALHVAVKRGWPFLVHMIANLFKVVPQEKADGLTIAGLEELLLASDTDYNLDALALAVVNGNELIVKILAQASLNCKGNPYQVPSFPGVTEAISRVADEVDRTSTGFSSDRGLTDKLWSIMCEIVGPDLENHVKKYDKNLSYNFLPVRFFLPHHWISTGTPEKSLLLLGAMKRKLDTDDPKSELLEYISSLKDGRGKTLAHVATLANLVHVVRLETNRRELFLDVGDGAGRTVAHGFVDQLKDLNTDTLSFFNYFFRLDFRVNDFTRKCSWKNQGLYTYFDLDALCTRNGYIGHHFENLTKVVAPEESSNGPQNVRVLHESSPLHYVALHDTFTTFTTLIQMLNYMEPGPNAAELDWNVRCIMRQRSPNSILETVCPNYFLESEGDCSWSILQVAAMSGNRSVLRALLNGTCSLSSFSICNIVHNCILVTRQET